MPKSGSKRVKTKTHVVDNEELSSDIPRCIIFIKFSFNNEKRKSRASSPKIG
jgi:hypothetical protein